MSALVLEKVPLQFTGNTVVNQKGVFFLIYTVFPDVSSDS